MLKENLKVLEELQKDVEKLSDEISKVKNMLMLKDL